MWMNDIAKALDPKVSHIINDSKTPSGQVHVGSLRGVLIHDAVTRHLKNNGYDVKFTYGIDDYDPMDGLPHDAPDELIERMGEPLCNIPAPNGSNASDFADHYISDFLEIFKELGVEANIYRMRDVYRSGKFNDAIQIILENAGIVREIYKDVSGSDRPSDWYPYQVVCENCGKIGTTEVFNYENGKVSYRCRKDLVSWAEGCSHEGKVSPFNGNGKLPWKLEWAAKWFVFGITVEGAGKDHCTKGGSRDIACQVIKKVFNKIPPLNIPYEFFLVKGAKMSSSKGVGASARSMADFLPPEVLRYLMIKPLPKRSVNFSTDLNPMLKLFNEYDTLICSKNTSDMDEEKLQLINMIEVLSEPKGFTPISFQLLISLLQLPHISIDKEISKRLGKELTEQDRLHLEKRVKSARYWLDHFASDEDIFELQDVLPSSWVDLSEAQKLFLHKLLLSIDDVNWVEEDLQNHIFEVARRTPVPPKLAFSSIYKVFLNKESGPKAGALLSFLEKQFVRDRLNDAKIHDWYSCYNELGEETDQFTNFVGEIKNDIANLEFSPELYLCAKSNEDSRNPDTFGFGLGIIRATFINKGKAFSRLIKLKFEGYDEIEGQKRGLIDNMILIADELKDEFGIASKISEEIELHMEYDISKVDTYLAELNQRKARFGLN